MRSTSGKGEPLLRKVAEESGLRLEQVRRAINFYAEYPDEVDRRIAADDEAARQSRATIERRQRLLSG